MSLNDPNPQLDAELEHRWEQHRRTAQPDSTIDGLRDSSHRASSNHDDDLILPLLAGYTPGQVSTARNRPSTYVPPLPETVLPAFGLSIVGCPLFDPPARKEAA